MISTYTKLNSLEVNKNVVFTTPFEDENTCLTRKGVLYDSNNSFSECIISSFCSEYTYENEENRNKIFTEFKRKLFLKSNWVNNEKFYKYFYNTIHNCCTTLYKYVEDNLKDKNNSENLLKDIDNKIFLKIIKNKIIKNIPLFEVLFEIFSINDIKDKILVDSENKNKSINKYKNTIIKKLNKYIASLDILSEIEKKKYNIIEESILDLFNTILNYIDEDVFKYYLTKITNIECNEENIVLISDVLNINIYFIDSTTRLPVLIEDKQKYKNSQSLIILKVENNFEIVGKLLTKNKIKNIFLKDETIIKKLNAFLFDNKKLKKDYPDLLKYKEVLCPPPPNNSLNNSDNNSDNTSNEDSEVNDSSEDESKNLGFYNSDTEN